MKATDLGARHLGRRSPPNAWEAYFLIGIFPAKSALRWCKLHLFSGGARRDRHCLSAAEAIDGPPERLLLRATADRVEAERRVLRRDELLRSDGGWEIRSGGLYWGGSFPDLRLSIPDAGIGASMRPRDVVFWARLPRVLSYWGAFGPLAWDGPEGRCEGLGVVEHAWGADTRLDVARFAPGRWQWDVLACDDGTFAAGLAVAPFGERLVGLRSGGNVGGEAGHGRGMKTDVVEWGEEKGRRVPARWRGAIALTGGTVRYDARATTPVADTVPDGGFLGFAFDGEWRPESGASRPVAGSGFCEYRALHSLGPTRGSRRPGGRIG
jgi:hypothetical protein